MRDILQALCLFRFGFVAAVAPPVVVHQTHRSDNANHDNDGHDDACVATALLRGHGGLFICKDVIAGGCTASATLPIAPP